MTLPYNLDPVNDSLLRKMILVRVVLPATVVNDRFPSFAFIFVDAASLRKLAALVSINILVDASAKSSLGEM